MSIEDISSTEIQKSKVSAIYDIFDESLRLKSKAGRVEFLTTVRQIEKYLKPGMRILDLGPGTGEYSFYFAKKGFEVTAVEIVEKHVKQIKEKITEDISLEVFQGNAVNLSMIEDKAYDVVLSFGPLYHFLKNEDKLTHLKEVKRVCKDNGKIFLAFISNDMVITTEAMCYNSNYFKSKNYNHETFKVVDEPFVFHTVAACRNLINTADLKIMGEVAADGLSELLADKINSMDEESYEAWLKYHFYCCEKPEFFGASNHLLFVAEKFNS
ncbi:class I SAM-dependent methyltransferase [Clostridium sp. C8-1-8]|uniref:class I SAM-dependent methyltransferase n=1 Tax=Clostridium sp. C8-1-8 TaxID=2698831 RepID=UPI001372149B|nr:class I SAM-dependent methyltransferase [Clostridium sp. C8-1-8]